MNKITFITGPSASGKGTRIVRLISHLDSLYEAEVWERELLGRKDRSRIKKRDVGRYYKEVNLFVLGYFSKDEKTWQSLDHICTFDLSLLFKELEYKGIDVLCDMNSTLVNHPTIPLWTLENDNVEVIYFYHKCMKETLRRINKRRVAKGKSEWSVKDYEESTVFTANNKSLRLFERNDFSEKLKVNSRVKKDWLIDHFNKGDK